MGGDMFEMIGPWELIFIIANIGIPIILIVINVLLFRYILIIKKRVDHIEQELNNVK